MLSERQMLTIDITVLLQCFKMTSSYISPVCECYHLDSVHGCQVGRIKENRALEKQSVAESETLSRIVNDKVMKSLCEPGEAVGLVCAQVSGGQTNYSLFISVQFTAGQVRLWVWNEQAGSSGGLGYVQFSWVMFSSVGLCSVHLKSLPCWPSGWGVHLDSGRPGFDSYLHCGSCSRSDSYLRCGSCSRSDSYLRCGSCSRSDSYLRCGSCSRSDSYLRCGSCSRSDSYLRCGSCSRSDSLPSLWILFQVWFLPSLWILFQVWFLPSLWILFQVWLPTFTVDLVPGLTPYLRCGSCSRSDSYLHCGSCSRSDSYLHCGSCSRSSHTSGPGFDSYLRCGSFSRSSHTSDSKIGNLKATPWAAWRYRVSTGTG